MSPTPIVEHHFNRLLSAEDKAERDAAIASNEAFVAAMVKASAKGREHVQPGTFVDTTPPVGVRLVRAIAPRSACGSPAAMCAGG